MSFKRFLLTKTFYKHLGVILGLSLMLIFVVILSLNSYTGHGDYILIPPLEGLDGDSLVANSDPNFLQYVLADSIYDSKGRPGSVSRQQPLVGAKVKKGRKVYLTIVTKGHEFIPMPNLTDLSVRRAVEIIYESRLRVNQLIFVDNFARNAVLAQLIRQDTIAPDSLVLIGSAINLVVGNGHNPGGVQIPFLIGKTAEEARQIIYKASLNFAGADTLRASSRENLRVYRQYPSYTRNDALFLGDPMRITLRSSNDFDFDSLVFQLLDDTKVDTLLSDSLLLNIDLKEF